MLTDWAAVLDVVQRAPPATAEELSRLEDDLRRPFLGFEDSRRAADTFEQFCLRTDRVADLLLKGDAAQQGDEADEV